MIFFLKKKKIISLHHKKRPIGSNITNMHFIGTLDGNFKFIRNLKIQNTQDYTGLFAYGNGATVKDINFINTNIISNSSFVGIVFGYSDYSSISNCVIQNGSIFATGKGTDVGAIVGKKLWNSPRIFIFLPNLLKKKGSFNNGSISYSQVDAFTINAEQTNSVGGLMGYAFSSNSKKSFPNIKSF